MEQVAFHKPSRVKRLHTLHDTMCSLGLCSAKTAAVWQSEPAGLGPQGGPGAQGGACSGFFFFFPILDPNFTARNHTCSLRVCSHLK